VQPQESDSEGSQYGNVDNLRDLGYESKNNSTESEEVCIVINVLKRKLLVVSAPSAPMPIIGIIA
jgi:hypothetical protein